MTDNKRPKAGGVEERKLDLAIEGRRIRGRIPYGVESRDMGGWSEVIEPGALRATKLDDLVATVDHAGVPLARYPTTLDLEDRSDGLHWSLEPPQSRTDVTEAVERGDLKAGSWRMRVGKDEWRGDTRHIHEITELRDVAVVTAPAYPDGADRVQVGANYNDCHQKRDDASARRQEDGDGRGPLRAGDRQGGGVR